jgi:hypothetical protein
MRARANFFVKYFVRSKLHRTAHQLVFFFFFFFFFFFPSPLHSRILPGFGSFPRPRRYAPPVHFGRGSRGTGDLGGPARKERVPGSPGRQLPFQRSDPVAHEPSCLTKGNSQIQFQNSKVKFQKLNK